MTCAAQDGSPAADAASPPPRRQRRFDLDVGGGRLEAVELPGDPGRRALVLLHEGLGSVGLWRRFPEQLAEATGRRVIAFSRAGHGFSDAPPAPRTATFFHAEALEVLPRVLELVEAPEPILVGHSDGGSIALIHAGHHRVTGVVTLAAHVFVEDVSVDAIERIRESYLDGDLRERMAPHHADPDAAFWGWCDVWLDPAFRAWDLTADTAEVTAPTLVIQGRDDAYGTLEQVDRIVAAAGDARPLVVAGGHSPHLDRPDEVVGAVARFAAPLP
ncbi:MAG: alpha/beta fold hydrolase [Solirubrobacterales bacterium]|nr:alpha/beta fold hydrolase [Solirubrobacterales bacterium]